MKIRKQMKCDITEYIPRINDKGADLHIFHQSPCLKGKKKWLHKASVPLPGPLTLMGSVLF